VRRLGREGGGRPRGGTRDGGRGDIRQSARRDWGIRPRPRAGVGGAPSGDAAAAELTREGMPVPPPVGEAVVAPQVPRGRAPVP